MHKIAGKSWSEKIFKAYDIRGVYPAEINEDAAYKIARAFARYLRMGKAEGRILKILVSSDKRESSPALKEAFVDGLSDEGAEIIDAGVTTTPHHYFAVNVSEADGGAMITASHLPLEFNGLKLSKRGAMPISEGAGMNEIKGDTVRGIFQNTDSEIKITKKDFTNDYIEFLENHFPYFGKEIKKMVSGEKIQWISFDTDEDRVMFDDEKGNRVPGDIITALLVRYFAEADENSKASAFRSTKKKPKPQVFQDFSQRDGARLSNSPAGEYAGLEKSVGEAIVYDLRSSRVVREKIEKYGFRPIESRVGHAFIKPLMRKENAAFGGELSGHYYFRDFFYCDSGIFAALAVLELMRVEKKTLSELIKPLRKYAKTEEINFKIAEKEKALDRIAAHFNDEKISYLDGITVEHWNSAVAAAERWWFNLRLSNTENLVRLNLEASTQKLLDKKKKLIFELLKDERLN